MSPARMAKSLPVMPRVDPPLSVYLKNRQRYPVNSVSIVRVEAMLLIAGSRVWSF